MSIHVRNLTYHEEISTVLKIEPVEKYHVIVVNDLGGVRFMIPLNEIDSLIENSKSLKSSGECVNKWGDNVDHALARSVNGNDHGNCVE